MQKFHNLLRNVAALDVKKLKTIRTLVESLLEEETLAEEPIPFTLEEFTDFIFKLIDNKKYVFKTAYYISRQTEHNIIDIVESDIGYPLYWSFDKHCDKFNSTVNYINDRPVPFDIPVKSLLGARLMAALEQNNITPEDAHDFKGHGYLVFLSSPTTTKQLRAVQS